MQPAFRYLSLIFVSLIVVSCSSTSSRMDSSAAMIDSLSRQGPHQIRAYISMPDAPEYAGATIYYPLNASGLLGGVAVAPGFTERQRHINWWGSRLATHGYAVIVLDTNDPRDRPEVRAEALMAAVRTLRAEGQRRESPLFGRIDSSRMAVMGHSMGGGGALLAANAYSNELSAAIPFTSWQPEGNFNNITVPALVIAGEADTIAPVDVHAWSHYQSIATGTPKAFLEIKEGDHFVANNSAAHLHGIMGRYGIAWLRLYMDGDERYREFFTASRPSADSAVLSRYEFNE
ncbi:MAG: dienelactone hydrolase family protein [Gammaproteobacteria bacterium]|nr:dienelactone hydrolase family protein [Gammaproteobacteria bacterium]